MSLAQTPAYSHLANLLKLEASSLSFILVSSNDNMLSHREDFYITTDKSKIDIEYVHQFLGNTYWAKNIPMDTLLRCINGSICFSVFHLNKQVGFARVITDEATFAYLADVFIDENYRGKGLSRWLMEIIMELPSLQGLRRFMLGTRDAHGLYEKFGFKRIESTEPWMQIHQPYKESC